MKQDSTGLTDSPGIRRVEMKDNIKLCFLSVLLSKVIGMMCIHLLAVYVCVKALSERNQDNSVINFNCWLVT